jgi:hypothetical protein
MISAPVQLRRRHRPPEPSTLPQLALLLQQEARLLGLLDAFGVHLHAHAARQGDDHPHDGDVVIVEGQPTTKPWSIFSFCTAGA